MLYAEVRESLMNAFIHSHRCTDVGRPSKIGAKVAAHVDAFVDSFRICHRIGDGFTKRICNSISHCFSNRFTCRR